MFIKNQNETLMVNLDCVKTLGVMQTKDEPKYYLVGTLDEDGQKQLILGEFTTAEKAINALNELQKATMRGFYEGIPKDD